MDANRNLVNAEGLHVMGAEGAGPIVIPDDIVSFSIAQNGDIIGVNADGATVNTGQKLVL